MLRSTLIACTLLAAVIIGCKKENTSTEVLKTKQEPIDSIPDEPEDTAVPMVGARFIHYSDSSFEIGGFTYYTSDSLDMNKDGKYELILTSTFITSPAGHEINSDLRVLDDSTQLIATNDGISPEIMQVGDSLNSNWPWHSKSSWLLARDYVYTSEKVEYSYWNDKTGYIAVRQLNKQGIYKYGWIKISVSNYRFIKVMGYSFQK
ncbi:MAG: hypothetical protein V4616_01770 [Bacteroidota bacterium]